MQEPLLQLRPGWATLRQGPEQCRCLPDCVLSPFAGLCSELHSMQHVGAARNMSGGCSPFVVRSAALCQLQETEQVCQTAATGAFTSHPQQTKQAMFKAGHAGQRWNERQCEFQEQAMPCAQPVMQNCLLRNDSTEASHAGQRLSKRHTAGVDGPCQYRAPHVLPAAALFLELSRSLAGLGVHEAAVRVAVQQTLQTPAKACCHAVPRAAPSNSWQDAHVGQQ